MPHSRAVLLIALSWAATLPAQAAGSSAPSWYFGFDSGRSSVHSKVATDDDGWDPTAGLSLGYQVQPDVAVEAFARTLSFRLFDSWGGDYSYYPATHVGMAAVGALGLGAKFRLLGRAGLGVTTLEADTNPRATERELDPSLGAGLAWDFTRSWSAKLSATRFTRTQVTITTFGMDVRF